MKKFSIPILALVVLIGGAYSLGLFSTEPKGAPEEEAVLAASEEAAPTAAAGHETPHAEESHIAWFDGTVDEAFAKAEAEGKPVLLYWGAVWCPPCNQLKATIFKRPDFVEKSNEFVAVYLDGDTPRAQKYGEEFGNAGYPTLIILSDRETEVTRIPGGMNLEAYVHVLDLALARVHPVSELLTEIVDNGRTATPEELSLLAHYSWGQDKGRALGERDKSATFNALAQMTPADLAEEKARFEADYLEAVTRTQEDNEDPLEETVRADALQRALAFYADPAANRAQPYLATFYGQRLVKRLTDEESPERAELVATLTTALEQMAADESYSPAGKLRVYFGEARLAKLSSEEVPEALKTEVREAVDAALADAKTDYERSAVMNASVGILIETGQDDYAGELMKKEVETSPNAYYWMVDLADLAEEAEQTDQAVAWLESAYKDSKGFATRIQWGSYYVDGLARMRPDDAAGLEAAAMAIIGELAAQDDSIYARNKGGVKRIGRSLTAWAGSEPTAEQQAVLDKVTGAFDAICDKQFSDADELSVCKALIRPAEA